VTRPELPFEDFCQRLLSLFDEGRFTATYKYAVLIGLLDTLAERVDRRGRAPEVVHTRDLAEAVLELYWPHTRRFPYAAKVLVQNRGGQAEIVTAIAQFRGTTVGDATAPLSVARARAADGYRQLVRRIEFKLIEMPLGKLQVIGNLHQPFIYDLGWERDHPPRWSAVKSDAFDGVLLLRPGAGQHLLRAGGLVRPLVQREWALTVSAFNDELLGDDLDAFLFGADRLSLKPVARGLRELAADRCFYCDRTVGSAPSQIDHFLAWTRHIDNGLANLVFAHASCNNAKRAYLAAEPHVERWVRRLIEPAYHRGLVEMAEAHRWDFDPESSVAAARGIYLALCDGYPLWQERGVFTPASRSRLAEALNVGP
jgi:hypothetical protein